ncbi:MAG: cadmium-translocating P-type ATPase [Lachnospiraceae bacterium]|nr:cadmium-translocating P-type ATPase [Lachnospiraceae bacterium]
MSHNEKHIHSHDAQEHQEHEHGCCCGQEHTQEHHKHQEHEHTHDCCCGQEHEHEHHRQFSQEKPADANTVSGVKITYLVENLGCANCAAKMERRINDLPEVNHAVLTFATKQLRVTVTPEAAHRKEGLTAKLQEICSSIESEVTLQLQVSARTGKKSVSDSQTADSSKSRFSEQQRDLISIIIGAVLFAAGEILERLGLIGAMTMLPSAVFIISYLILGGQIVLTALKNLVKGQIFDENFLMSLATLGAFAIGNFPEAVGVMLFYRIGEYFEEAAVSRSRSQIMDAVDLRPETVNLVLGNDIQVLPAEEAQIGDLLLIRPGDRIPLDGAVVEGESRLDTSPITGEPVPVKIVPGDSVTSGCINTSGQLKMQVEKTLEHSMVTRILDSVENAAASKPKIDRFITRFSRIYTPFVVIAALATAIIPSLITGNWHHWIYTALTFLVISCPCALVLSVPLAFFSGIGAGSKKGILFKGGVSIEGLNHISTVVMDKTGTITKGNFVVQQIVPLQNNTEEEVLRICASLEQHSTHPIGASILAAAQERNLVLENASSLTEIAGHGIQAELASGQALAGNKKLMEQSQIDVSDLSQNIYGTEVFVALNHVLIGCIFISDTIKPEASTAIHALKQLHITTAMLTGDAQESAQAVAAETGIEEVYAKLLPEDKLAKLQEIRKRNGSVMFVGDGINDAPVLAGADVGAAMGSGADAAIEAADVVFMTSNVEAVPDSIAIARATTQIAWQNVVFALAVKALVMIFGLTGHASMWMAVFADSGVAMLCVLNSIRMLYKNFSS